MFVCKYIKADVILASNNFLERGQIESIGEGRIFSYALVHHLDHSDYLEDIKITFQYS